ncbi:MATE family efflux transporter [Prolixibacteraceae bacterium JC049]|nr:MATE family efflux transporter [Prolixibacteraceae bacterium JC049]
MNREILKLAIPNIVSNITIPLLGIIDLALMGHMESEKYIGAIALGTMIFNVLYWAFAFLRMGTSGFTAQAFGEKNKQEQALNLFRSTLTAFIGASLLILFQIPIEFLSFNLIGGGQEVEQLAREYFYIRIWAAPATISLFAFNGWYLGMQNARIPMIIALVINVLNILFNLLFVFGFGMKSEGVALGTLLAQYSGFATALFYLKKDFNWVFRYWQWKAITQLSKLKLFFKVNSDIMIRTFCIIGVFSFFTSKSASIDDTVLAVNSLLLQFLFFFSYFIDGFAFAGEAIIGKYLGAKDRDNYHKAIQKLFVWGGGLALLFSVCYYLGGELILGLLTNQEALIETSNQYLPWLIAVPIISFASFIWDGIYIGATASKAMRNTMLIATFGLFIPGFIIGHNYIGNHALWLAMLLFMFGRGFFQTIIAPKAIYRLL